MGNWWTSPESHQFVSAAMANPSQYFSRFSGHLGECSHTGQHWHEAAKRPLSRLLESGSVARTPESYMSKKFDVGDRHYLLYKQEPSASSPEGTTFGVFILPPVEYALPLVERLQSPVDTEEDMWRWAQEAALSHAKGGSGLI
jgi:hypothetical protein